MKTPDLTGVTQILVTGQRVSFERDASGWICTGWQQSLPVARKPVTEAQVLDILSRYPNCALRY
jgi:hypothetical protein